MRLRQHGRKQDSLYRMRLDRRSQNASHRLANVRFLSRPQAGVFGMTTVEG